MEILDGFSKNYPLSRSFQGPKGLSGSKGAKVTGCLRNYSPDAIQVIKKKKQKTVLIVMFCKYCFTVGLH